MQPGPAADHSPPSSAAVMEEESYVSTHPVDHTGLVKGPRYLYLYLLFGGKLVRSPVLNEEM